MSLPTLPPVDSPIDYIFTASRSPPTSSHPEVPPVDSPIDYIFTPPPSPPTSPHPEAEAIPIRDMVWEAEAEAIPSREMTFEESGLCEQLVQACQHMGWRTPSAIQCEAIVKALKGRDLSVLAPESSGVTGAFALLILNALLELDCLPPFFACVVSPSRVRAIEICQQWKALGHDSAVNCRVVVNATETERQELGRIKCPHIVVGTPAELVSFWDTDTDEFSLEKSQYLVLDVVDSLVEEPHRESLIKILTSISQESKVYLLAKTVNEDVLMLNRTLLKDPVKVKYLRTRCNVEQQYCLVPADYKDGYLVSILSGMCRGTSIVFTSTSESTRVLYRILRRFGINSVRIDAVMSRCKLARSLIKFREGYRAVLICTDRPTHNLDIPHVDVVINYHLPENFKDYGLRVYRSGCVGHPGTVINLVYHDELRKIEILSEGEISELLAQEETLHSLESVKNAREISIMKMEKLDRKRKIESDDNFEVEATTFIGRHRRKYQKMPWYAEEKLASCSSYERRKRKTYAEEKFASCSSCGRRKRKRIVGKCIVGEP